MARKLLPIICLVLLFSACTKRGEPAVDKNGETGSTPTTSGAPAQGEGDLPDPLGQETGSQDVEHVTKDITDFIRIDADVIPYTGSCDVVEISYVPFAKEDLEALQQEFNVDYEMEQETNPNGKPSYSFVDGSAGEGEYPASGHAMEGALSYSSDMYVVYTRLQGTPFSWRGLAQGGAQGYLNKQLLFETPQQALDKAIACAGKFLRQNISKRNSLVFGFDKETIQASFAPTAPGEESLGKNFKYSDKCDNGVYYMVLPLEYNGIPVYGDEPYTYVDDSDTQSFFPRVTVAISAGGIEKLWINEDFDVVGTASEDNAILPADKAVDTATELLKTYAGFPGSQFEIFKISLQYAVKPEALSESGSSKLLLSPVWVFEGYEADEDSMYTPFVLFVDAISGEVYQIKAG